MGLIRAKTVLKINWSVKNIVTEVHEADNPRLWAPVSEK